MTYIDTFLKMLETQENRQKEITEKVTKILDELGIQMEISGCGCCNSPNFSFEYKGERIADCEDSYSFDNFKRLY